MDLIFTDLDGTLLDGVTYDWQAARPALNRLRRRGVPWVLVTSKTRAEVEFWRGCLQNEHPFIVENGGAAFVPSGYFPHAVPGSKRREDYDFLEWGTPYQELVADLREASKSSHCRVRAFHAMTAEEVAGLCGLPPAQGVLAKQREYDEPFLILDPDRTGALLAAITELGRHWTKGGGFWHILGANDKALAVTALSALFEQAHAPLRTIGLGDGLNDASFLNVVTVPVIVRSREAAELKARVPRGMVTDQQGPAGWNDAILSLIAG